MNSDIYKDIDKPGNPEFPETEGRCPLCSIRINGNKTVYYDKTDYDFDFIFYWCHIHGYFRWLGSDWGHVRPIFPNILKYARRVGHRNPQLQDIPEMVTIICPDCGFEWEETKTPTREETICPDCRRRLDFPKHNMSSSCKEQKTLTDF